MQNCHYLSYQHNVKSDHYFNTLWTLSFLSDLPYFSPVRPNHIICLFIHSFHFRYLLGVYHKLLQGYGQKYNGTFFHSQDSWFARASRQIEKQHPKWERCCEIRAVQRGCVAQSSGYMNSIWRLDYLTKSRTFLSIKNSDTQHFSNIIQSTFHG